MDAARRANRFGWDGGGGPMNTPTQRGNPVPQIIAAILAVVGPLIAKWLEAWLASRLKDAAWKVPPTGSTEADARELLTAVYRDIPWIQVGRWRLVRRLIDDIPPAVATGKSLSTEQRAAIVRLGGFDG